MILETALGILRREGLDAVTMRRVAAELETGAASLYVYVSGRDELCQAMLEKVAGSVPLEAPDRQRWRQQLYTLLDALRRSWASHPGLGREALTNPPADERTLLVTENILGLLRAGGVAAQDAAWAAEMLPALTMAAAVSAEARSPGPEEDDAGDDAFIALSPDRFPNITALSSELTRGDADTRFRFTVMAFLNGLPSPQPPTGI
jgi:AcrR family transcriptional regulator